MSRIVPCCLLVLFLVFSVPAARSLSAEKGVAAAPDRICPVLVGSPIPPITVQTVDGKAFDLNRAIAQKPTVLIYFRGGW